MPSILVIEHEGRYIERIQDALATEGWKARFVAGRPEALRAAASEQPDLVLVNSELPGAAEMLRTFATHQGGPGAVALIPEHQPPMAPAEVGADEVVSKPFTDQQLRLVVRRGLNRSLGKGDGGAGNAAAAPPAAAPDEPKLTSADIFGDLLAEVDAAPGEGGADESGAGEAPPQAPAQTPAARAGSADSRLGSDDPEIAKRLEITLSGVLDGPKARPREEAPAESPDRAAAPPPPKPKRSVRRDDDVDELLNMTLSSLESPVKPKKRKRSDDLDLSDIAALTGTGRKKPRPKPADGAPEAATPTPPPEVEAPPEMEPPPLPEVEEVAAEPVAEVEEEVARPRAADELDEAEFDEVFDASWGVEEEGPSSEVLPPDDFEPSVLGDASEAGTGDTGTGDTGTGAVATGTGTATAVETAGAPAVTAVAAEDGDRFGHYQLLDRIAIGGMAEVWKARMSGVEGFQKTVAIKKILPQMTDNADFIGMFIDEAKLAAQLNHPNITHIYDLGKIERDYYIAMEYVEGRNLRDVLTQARQKGKPLPVGLALLVAARLASALDYAHRKRDFDDRELELVHRDVSPQNVLLSYEGDIKLCDFGIVKAVTKATHTQMGALKGKLQYMSPEQAWGRAVDSRSDIFSLGALLFEMLTGERLFAGDNEISVLESVRECHVRSPEELHPGLPDGVEAVVLKALEKEPDDRYADAGELQAELEAILYRLQPTPTQADLGAWLRQLDATETLDEEARRQFSWSAAVAAADGAAAAAGEADDGAMAAEESEAAGAGAEGASVASPFGVAPADVGATQPVNLAALDPTASREDASEDTVDETGRGDTAGAGDGPVGDGTSDDGIGDDAIGDGTGAAAGEVSEPHTAAGLPPAAATVETAEEEAAEEDDEPTVREIGVLTPPEGADVTPEEGGRKGLWILVAAIALLLVLGAVWYFGFGPGDAASEPEPAPEAVEEAAATADDPDMAAEETAAEPVDLQSMVDEQIQAKEEEIEAAVRNEREPELEQMRAELRRLQRQREQALADAAAIDAAAAEAAGSEGDDGGDGQ